MVVLQTQTQSVTVAWGYVTEAFPACPQYRKRGAMAKSPVLQVMPRSFLRAALQKMNKVDIGQGT